MLIFLFLIADLFDHLYEIMNNKPPFTDILIYYANLIPFAFVQMISWATFLGTLYLFFSFTRHSEIIAMKACGLKMTKIAAPVLFLGLIISVITFVVNDRIVPQTYKKAESILKEKIELTSDQRSKNKVITNTTLLSNNNQYFIRFFYPEENRMEDIRIHKLSTQNNSVKEKITAKKGLWVNNEWQLYDVSIHYLDSRGKIIKKPDIYEKTTLPYLTEKPADFIDASTDNIFLSSKELEKQVKKLKANDLNATSASAELHLKRAFPWQCFVIMLFTIPFLSKTGNIRRGMIKNIITCLLIVGAYHVTTAIASALGHSGVIFPFLSAWLSHIIFSIGGILFFENANY